MSGWTPALAGIAGCIPGIAISLDELDVGDGVDASDLVAAEFDEFGGCRPGAGLAADEREELLIHERGLHAQDVGGPLVVEPWPANGLGGVGLEAEHVEDGLRRRGDDARA